jgi:sulfate-transporting ATPase
MLISEKMSRLWSLRFFRLGGVVGEPAAAVATTDADANDGLPRVPQKKLDIQNLSVNFGGVKALTDVSCAFQPSEVVAIIGPNGAGKTTFIDAVMGFVTSSGQVVVGDKNLSRARAYARSRSGLGRAFQSLELFEDLSVAENLLAATDRHGILPYFRDIVRPGKASLPSDITVVLSMLGLSERVHDLPSSLTYGQRRLLAVGRAIVGWPSVLLLDEPCSGLDAQERQEVGRVVRLLRDKTDMTVILVEHDVDLVRRIAERTIVLEYGSLIADGPTEEVLSDPRVVAAYLGERVDDELDRVPEGSLEVALRPAMDHLSP